VDDTVGDELIALADVDVVVVVLFRRSALRTKPASVSDELSFELMTPTPPIEHVLKSKNQKGASTFSGRMGTGKMDDVPLA